MDQSLGLKFVSLGTIPRGWARRKLGGPKSTHTAPGHKPGTSSLVESCSQGPASSVYSMPRKPQQGSGLSRGESLHRDHSALSSSTDNNSEVSLIDVFHAFPKRSITIKNRSRIYSQTRGTEYNDVILRCIKDFGLKGKWSRIRSEIYNECLYVSSSQESGTSEDDLTSSRSSSEGSVTDDFVTPGPRQALGGQQQVKPRHRSDIPRDSLKQKNLYEELGTAMSQRDLRADARSSIMSEQPKVPQPVHPATPAAAVAGLLNPDLQSTIIGEALKHEVSMQQSAPLNGGEKTKEVPKSDTSGTGTNLNNDDEKDKDDNNKKDDVEKFAEMIKTFLTSEHLKRGRESRWLLWSLIRMSMTFEANRVTGEVKHDPSGAIFLDKFTSDEEYCQLTEQLLDHFQITNFNRCSAWSDQEHLAETLHILSEKYKADQEEEKEIKKFMKHPGNLIMKKVSNFFMVVSATPIQEASLIISVLFQHKSLYYKTLRNQKKEVAAMLHFHTKYGEKLNSWNEEHKGKGDNIEKEKMLEALQTVSDALGELVDSMKMIFCYKLDKAEDGIILGFSKLCDFEVVDVVNLDDIRVSMEPKVLKNLDTAVFSTKYNVENIEEDFPFIKQARDSLAHLMHIVDQKYEKEHPSAPVVGTDDENRITTRRSKTTEKENESGNFEDISPLSAPFDDSESVRSDDDISDKSVILSPSEMGGDITPPEVPVVSPGSQPLEPGSGTGGTGTNSELEPPQQQQPAVGDQSTDVTPRSEENTGPSTVPVTNVKVGMTHAWPPAAAAAPFTGSAGTDPTPAAVVPVTVPVTTPVTSTTTSSCVAGPSFFTSTMVNTNPNNSVNTVSVLQPGVNVNMNSCQADDLRQMRLIIKDLEDKLKMADLDKQNVTQEVNQKLQAAHDLDRQQQQHRLKLQQEEELKRKKEFDELIEKQRQNEEAKNREIDELRQKLEDEQNRQKLALKQQEEEHEIQKEEMRKFKEETAKFITERDDQWNLTADNIRKQQENFWSTAMNNKLAEFQKDMEKKFADEAAKMKANKESSNKQSLEPRNVFGGLKSPQTLVANLLSNSIPPPFSIPPPSKSIPPPTTQTTASASTSGFVFNLASEDQIRERERLNNMEPRNHQNLSSGGNNFHNNQNNTDDYQEQKIKAKSTITLLVEEISSSYPKYSVERIKEMNTTQLTTLTSSTKVCLQELEELYRKVSLYTEKYQEDIKVTIPGQNDPITVNKYVRSAKLEYNIMQDAGIQQKKVKEEKQKNQTIQLQKNLGKQTIPEVQEDGDVIPYLIHVSENFRDKEIDRGDLAASMFSSIKSPELKALVEPMKGNPSKIWNVIMEDKIYRGGACKAYFTKTLLRKGLTKVYEEGSIGKKKKAQRQARLAGINTATNLKKLRQGASIKKEEWDNFNKNYCIARHEMVEWERIYNQYSRGNENKKRTIIHQMRSNVNIGAVGLTEDDRSLTTIGSAPSYANTSIMDQNPIDRTEPDSEDEDEVNFSISPANPILSEEEHLTLMVVFWEMLNAIYKENPNDDVKESKRNLIQNVEDDEEDHGRDEADGASNQTPAAASKTVRLLRLDVMPENFRKPPMPSPGQKALDNYPSLPCLMENCQKRHCNGTLWWCPPFMKCNYKIKKDIADQFQVCERCLSKHSGPCQTQIDCACCRNEGRPYGHNIALCPYSRYRFGVDLNKKPGIKKKSAEHQTKLNLHHAEAVSNMNPEDFENEEEDDETEVAGGKIFMLKGVPDGVERSKMRTNDDDTKCTEDDKGIFKIESFEVVSDLVRQLVQKARACKKSIPTTYIAETSASVANVRDESALLLSKSEAGTEAAGCSFDEFERQVEEAMSHIASDIKVLTNNDELRQVCRFVLLNKPFKCISALKQMTEEKLALGECLFNRDLKMIDASRDKVKTLEVKHTNNKYRICRKGDKLFKNISDISVQIHDSSARMAILGYVRVNLNVNIEKWRINKLIKMKSVLVYTSIPLHMMTDDQCYRCQITIFLIQDTGCSHSCLVEEFLDLICAEKVRECNTRINTASEDDIMLRDHYYALNCQTRTGKVQRIVMQKLSRSALPMCLLSDDQVQLISQELGDVNGTRIADILECMKTPNFAMGLIGQNCQFIKLTEISEPRHLGFQKGKIYHQNLKVFETSNICLNDICITGELGLDPGTLNKDSYLVVPEEYVLNNKIREQFQIPNYLLRNIGVYLKSDQDKKDCINQVELIETNNAYLKLTMSENEVKIFQHQTNDEAISNICADFVGANNNTKQLLTKADTSVISDYILAESCHNIINPLCKVHSDLSRRDAANCISCKVLSGDRQANIDVNVHNAIEKNIRLEENPNRKGKMRLRQTLTFTHDVEDIGNIGASNLEASIKRFDRLVKSALKRDFWPILNTQVVDRINRGEMATLQPDEMKKILNGEILAQYVSQSYVEAPHKATKFRIISDSSMLIKGLDTSIAGTNRSPRIELQNFVGVTTSQRFLSCFIALDIMRAYNGVLLDCIQSYLFCTPWCSEPEKYGTERLFLLRMLCLQFGLGSAGSDLKSGIVVHGIPRMKLEESKYLTLLKTFVDNLNSLSFNPSIAAAVTDDIMSALDDISLIIDKVQCPRWLTEIGNKEINDLIKKYPFIQTTGISVQMGYIWCLDTDTIKPNLKINLHESRRGCPLGPGFETEDVSTIVWTRRLLSKCTPALFDSLGAMLGVPIVVTKLILSKVCRVVPMANIDDDIRLYDKDLAELITKVWTDIQRFYSEFIPLRRAAIMYQYKLKAIYCSHDGSQSAYSSTIHLLSQHGETKEFDSYILGAKSTCSEASPYNNEAKSFTLALLHVLSVIGSNEYWIEKDEPLDIIMIGDNIATSHTWGSADTREMLTRVLKYSTLRCCFELSDKLPQARVRFCWAPAKYSISDYNSKLRTDMLDCANSNMWRRGPKLYHDINKMTTFTFLDYQNETWRHSPIPSLEGKRNVPFEELIEMKNAGQLKPVGKSKLFKRGVGAVSEDPDPIETAFVSTDSTKEEYSTCRVTQSTAFLCNSALFSTPGIDNDVDLSLTTLLCRTESDAELQEWFTISHFEHVQPSENEDTLSKEMYEAQNIYRRQSQFNVSSKPIPSALRINDELKLKYAKTRMTKNIFTKIGEPTRNAALVDTKIFAIKPSFCDEILSRRENFMFNFNVLKNILTFAHKLKSRITKDKQTNIDGNMSIITWRTIIFTDQQTYKVKDQEGISERFGIKCLSLRINNMIKPVLNGESKLLENIVLYVHKGETGNPKLPATHVHLKTCIDQIFSNNFGVYVFSMKRQVSKILSKCYNCKRTKPKKYENSIGPRYALGCPHVGLFAAVSVDPCFSLYVKSLPPSRQSSMLIHILHVTCLSTGCNEQVILRGMTHQDIALGLRTVEMSHNTKISVIFSDRGSNLRKELLEECGSWVVANHPSGAQQRNFVESRIKLARGIWRNVFRQCKGETGKYAARLDFTEVLYLTRMITLSINSIPFTVLSENTQGFSPSAIIYGAGLTEAILCENEAVDFINKPPLKKYKEYMEKILKCRNEVLLTLSIQGENRNQKYNMRNRVRANVDKNDIVLWQHQNNKYTLATVIRLLPPPSNSAEIRYGGGSPKVVAIESLHVLVKANSEEGKHLQERDVQKMSEEIQRVLENSNSRVV